MAIQHRFDTTESQRIHSPWDKVGFVVWAVIFGLTVGLFVLAFYDQVIDLWGQSDVPLFRWYLLPLNLVSALAFAGVSAILAVRRYTNWMVWVTAVMLVTMGLGLINPTIHILRDTRPVISPLLSLLQAIAGLSFSYFLYTFPLGYFSSKVVAAVGITAMIWFTAVNGLLEILGLVDLDTLISDYAPFFMVTSFILYGAPILIRTELHRKDIPTAQQQQLKLISGGLMLALAGYLISVLHYIILSSIPADTVAANALMVQIINLIFSFLLTVALTAVPVTIGVAMMRYRLWDVDFFINRSLVYGILTVLLAILVVGELIIFQWLLRFITGQEQVTVALIIAAMVSGGLFQPTRRRLQHFVDRQLYGIHISYDKPKKDALEETAVSATTAERLLGPYEVQDLVGRGGMAEVFRGRHTTLNRTVAIKMMRTDQAATADFQTRFEREAQAIAQLRHPNIIEIFDFGTVESTYYMVMEYVAGQSLADYLKENGRLTLAEALIYISDVASALDYAHGQNIVHRDIKPSNVMLQPASTLGRSGRPAHSAILTDFGIAKIRGGNTAITKTGMVGTLDYIAPEQIQDAKDVDGRADVYALGVMAYQMLTGHLPFQGSNPAAVLIGHMQQSPPDPRRYQPDLPEEIVTALYKALAKQSNERFATAGEMVKAMSHN